MSDYTTTELLDIIAERGKRIAELKSSQLVINVQPIEMDFGGEGVIIHMNDIAAMETLCIQKDKHIAELEAGLNMIMEDFEECGNLPLYKCSDSPYPMEAGGDWCPYCMAKAALEDDDG